MASYRVFIISLFVVGVSCGVAPDDTGLATFPPVPTFAPVATLAPPAALPEVATMAPPDTPTEAASDAQTVVTDGQSSGTTAPTAMATFQKADYKQSAIQMVLVLIFACIYKSKVVDEYPELKKFNEKSAKLQDENEVSACCNSLFTTNCMLAWCCHAPRAAHTFDKVGVMSYWPSVFLMMCCPCCTLTYTNACTDLNEKLGGEKRNCCMALLCAWCCVVCVVLQDAASLDAATGADTKCLSVEEGEAGSGSE